jgi:hypothetical protein
MPVFHTPAIETNTPSITSALHSLVNAYYRGVSREFHDPG